MKNKTKKQEIPIKNYIILGIICIITVLLTLYINAWIKTYKSNMYSVSPLAGNVNEVNINELKEPFVEVNKTILYVGYNHDKQMHDAEEILLKNINSKELSPYITYLNVTDSKDYINILSKRFNTKDEKVKKAPMLIYLVNGKTEEIINIKKPNDLSKKFNGLIDKFKVKDN